MLDVALQPHPTSPEPAVASLTLRVERERSRLRLTYRLAGRLDHIRVPAFAQLRREDRLWEHTCFELFVRQVGTNAYCELNVAPSGAWAAYAFNGYRDGMRDIEPFTPQIVVERQGVELIVRAVLLLDEWGPAFAAARLELAPSAVIENASGQRSYWAARHASDKPDFHHTDAFSVALDA